MLVGVFEVEDPSIERMGRMAQSVEETGLLLLLPQARKNLVCLRPLEEAFAFETSEFQSSPEEEIGTGDLAEENHELAVGLSQVEDLSLEVDLPLVLPLSLVLVASAAAPAVTSTSGTSMVESTGMERSPTVSSPCLKTTAAANGPTLWP